MKTSGWGKRAALTGAAIALAASSLFGTQFASAARVSDGVSARTFLLKLDSDSTVRAFRLNRDDGLADAKLAARSQKAEIAGAQSDVIDELPADADVIYRTHSLIAGVGVSASPGDQTLLEQIPGVQAVYPVAPKFVANSSAVQLQGAPSAWQATGFLGEGETIAVIDTGVDYTHSTFGGPGTESAYETAHASESQAASPSLFPNDKVVGGIDLVGDNYDSDSGSDTYQPVPHPDPNPLDCNGHGTHVAGSAAGYGVNMDGSTFDGPYDQSTDFGALRIGPGMAPEADIYAIRVFGCDGSSDVVADAIDRAVDPNNDGDPSDHVDVINMSLGSDFGSTQDGDSVAANAASQMGVTVVAAAGNSGDHMDISGSPGDSARVISVASSVDAESRIDGAQVTINGTPETFGITRSARYDWDNGGDLSGQVVAAPVGNETACAPYAGTPFTGKVVLVKWHDAAPECGSITRGDNLADAGAIGFIFASDSESFSGGINGDDVIPGVLMVKSGGDAIRAALDPLDPTKVTVDGTEVNSVSQSFPGDVDKVSSFSSRGIHATGNSKPDVTAVGNTVFSADVGTGNQGTSLSGTSMATPMVAGLAALVRQANPSWTPLQVKADIMNTAGHDLYVGGQADPSQLYGPTRVGAGRIDSPAALSNKVLAYDATNGVVSVSFGPVAADAPVTLTRQVTVDNHSGSTATYDVSYDPINEVPGAEFTASPSQVTVGAGQTAQVTVSLVIDDPTELTKVSDPTLGHFGEAGAPRETLAEASGRVLLVPTGPGNALRVPVYAAPRPASVMTQPGSLTIHRTAATASSPEQTAVLSLSGQGVGTESGDNGTGDPDPYNDIFSIAAGFELQATSGQSPQCTSTVKTSCWRLPEEKNADLKMVGFSSNVPVTTNPDAQMGYFALASQEPFAIPSGKAIFQIDIDVDGDDKPDLFVFNDRLGEDDTFMSSLFDPSLPKGQRVIDQQPINGRYGDTDVAAFDSDVIVLPVSLAMLESYGIDADNPRVSYGVETFSAFSDQAIDMIGVDPESGDLVDPLSANLFEPGILVTGETGFAPLLDDQPGADLTVTRNVASYQADAGKGLMMVHFHNLAGAKAQTVDLHGAPSTTELVLAPDSLSARVEATDSGLPEPSGTVVFSVDGVEVGSAPVVDGVAQLQKVVPSGATRQVEASYSGDADFEPSAAQAQRSDPVITATVKSRIARNSRGWYRVPVDVYFKCQTNGSELTEDCPYPRRLERDGRNLSVGAGIVAFDGGRAKVKVSGINIDRIRPLVRIRGVKAGKVYPKVKRARCVARDRTSGVLSCQISWSRKGRKVIYRATATDRAGNRRTVRVGTRIGR